MTERSFLGFVVCQAVLLLSGFSPLSADEIVIKEAAPVITSGDFDCSVFRSATAGTLPIVPKSDGLAAGEVWSFFNGQGVKRMDRLVLCLDIPPDAYRQSDITSIQLEIRDANDPTRVIESYSLASDSHLVVPGYEASDFRAEAQLAVNLGFDFMEKFSSSSAEKVVLNVEMNGESIVPEFYIAGEAPWFSGINGITLAAFVGFWVVVFLILFRLTNPDRIRRVPTGKKRALSA